MTSTTNPARCFSGNHPSTDGGNKKPVYRSIERKLLITSRAHDGRINPTSSIAIGVVAPVKPDRLLAPRLSGFLTSPDMTVSSLITGIMA